MEIEALQAGQVHLEVDTTALAGGGVPLDAQAPRSLNLDIR